MDAEKTMEPIGYHFHHKDAGDVRHMFLVASEMAKKNGMAEIHRVMEAQAEMVMQGLHIRDMTEVPDFMGDIEAFHQKFGLEYLGKPRILPDELFDFRSKFMQEEKDEYDLEQTRLARAQESHDTVDIQKGLEMQLDALVDLVYVTLGTAYLQFGPKVFVEAWKRVQAANMAKIRCEREGDSKRGSTFDVIKPEGWQAPDHSDLVADFEGRVYRHES